MAGTLIPRSHLFGNLSRLAGTVSPDGSHLAWVAPLDGVLNVWVAPVDAPDRACAVTDDAGRALLHERSPPRRADLIERPLLIAQGAHDPRVKRAESDQMMLSPTQPAADPPVVLLTPGDRFGPLNSEWYDHTDAKLVEAPYIVRIGGKHALIYSTGAYEHLEYRAGVAWSDTLLPGKAGHYRKVLEPDPDGVWGPSRRPEVHYLLQSQKPGWPNYTPGQVFGPGVASMLPSPDGWNSSDGRRSSPPASLLRCTHRVGSGRRVRLDGFRRRAGDMARTRNPVIGRDIVSGREPQARRPPVYDGRLLTGPNRCATARIGANPSQRALRRTESTWRSPPR